MALVIPGFILAAVGTAICLAVLSGYRWARRVRTSGDLSARVTNLEKAGLIAALGFVIAVVGVVLIALGE
jgi:hypothetical protein